MSSSARRTAGRCRTNSPRRGTARPPPAIDHVARRRAQVRRSGDPQRVASAATRVPAATPVAARRLPAWVVPLLLLAATVVAYAPAVRGGFVWDDDDYVTANATLRDL